MPSEAELGLTFKRLETMLAARKRRRGLALRDIAGAVAAGMHDPEHIEKHIKVPKKRKDDAQWVTETWWRRKPEDWAKTA